MRIGAGGGSPRPPMSCRPSPALLLRRLRPLANARPRRGAIQLRRRPAGGRQTDAATVYRLPFRFHNAIRRGSASFATATRDLQCRQVCLAVMQANLTSLARPAARVSHVRVGKLVDRWLPCAGGRLGTAKWGGLPPGDAQRPAASRLPATYPFNRPTRTDEQDAIRHESEAVSGALRD